MAQWPERPKGSGNPMSAAEGFASPTSMKLVVGDLAKSEAFYRRICSFKPASTLHFSLAASPSTSLIAGSRFSATIG